MPRVMEDRQAASGREWHPARARTPPPHTHQVAENRLCWVTSQDTKSSGPGNTQPISELELGASIG